MRLQERSERDDEKTGLLFEDLITDVVFLVFDIDQSVHYYNNSILCFYLISCDTSVPLFEILRGRKRGRREVVTIVTSDCL